MEHDHDSNRDSHTRRVPALAGLNHTVWTSSNLVFWTRDTCAVQTPVAPVAEVERPAAFRADARRAPCAGTRWRLVGGPPADG